jgi:hypothetical protein
MAEAGNLPAFVARPEGGGAYYARSRFRADTVLVANSRPLPDAEPVAAPPTEAIAEVAPAAGATVVSSLNLTELNTDAGRVVTVSGGRLL